MYQDAENPDPRREHRTVDAPDAVDAVDVENLDRGRLVPADAVDRLRDEWRDAQSTFVDDPSEAVARTRTLLTDFVRSMADQLDERGRRPALDTSTEDLRQELRQYRAAFDQLADV